MLVGTNVMRSATSAKSLQIRNALITERFSKIRRWRGAGGLILGATSLYKLGVMFAKRISLAAHRFKFSGSLEALARACLSMTPFRLFMPFRN